MHHDEDDIRELIGHVAALEAVVAALVTYLGPDVVANAITEALPKLKNAGAKIENREEQWVFTACKALSNGELPKFKTNRGKH